MGSPASATEYMRQTWGSTRQVRNMCVKLGYLGVGLAHTERIQPRTLRTLHTAIHRHLTSPRMRNLRTLGRRGCGAPYLLFGGVFRGDQLAVSTSLGCAHRPRSCWTRPGYARRSRSARRKVFAVARTKRYFVSSQNCILSNTTVQTHEAGPYNKAFDDSEVRGVRDRVRVRARV
ncbi:uncharacterized protein SCHCODRAFT_02169639 [Schizophyllum commune H4-8]|uniref:uncharacterized protein n=1 Tax=Schizophyllum commune (strain H4-8 / FGSC 9210) TaxID=578458 RepID=UPI00215E43A0|nr:uncharacterized protein SCHCODRAFT_02169639 [Schizophyllum commune H4-8]KAI5898620.1 hypothetical protein SCHCODRAFT_02169639 [Schizophyllum commune H4-8]